MRKLISRLSRHKWRTLFVTVLLAAILVFVFRGRLLLWMGNCLVIRDNLHTADVIHVIAGEDYRTDYALQLYKEGYAKKLFFTGGWCRIHRYNHGEHAEERALAAGIPPDDIAIDDSHVTSTFMEILRLQEWIGHLQTPIRSVIVVSDPFHMRRARWAYKKVLGKGIEVQMAPVPFRETPFRRVWWKDYASRKFVKEEYEKYVYYILRYQISRGKFRDWLATLDKE